VLFWRKTQPDGFTRQRNVWVAEGPQFSPRRLTRYTADDGQEITSLSLSADGRSVVYVRGGDHGASWDDSVLGQLYNPVYFKLFIWTLSAVICGIAGALYVPQVGIINPSEMSPANSIEIAIWAAVGGRGTLIGPVIGAAVVNLGKSWFTQAFPEYWLFLLGLLFILVTLYLPRGIAGLWSKRMA